MPSSDYQDPEKYKLPPFYWPDPVFPMSSDARGAPGSDNGIVCASTVFGVFFRCCPPLWSTLQTSAVLRARVATDDDMARSNANGCCSGRGSSASSSTLPPLYARVVGSVPCLGGARFTNCCACVASEAHEHIVLETQPVVHVEVDRVHSYLPLESLAAEMGPGSFYARRLEAFRNQETAA